MQPRRLRRLAQMVSRDSITATIKSGRSCAWPADLPEQSSQEVAGLELSDVLRVELNVQVEALVAGRHRDPRDDGQPVGRSTWCAVRVWPTGARVAAIEGVNWKPDSSAKTRWAPNRVAFFLPAATPPG